MTDYGHPLQFGSFVPPGSARPEEAVALSVISERAGLHLVTFQDHPYQPAMLDTWTLMSYVAARTERIHLSADVINLPLRPPAMLARAAASLDRLSGGRVDLGLGAGAFWDAIEAMGGTRLTAGDSVDALAEAINVIRAIWDTSEKGGVFLRGKHHPIAGAKRGPAPLHEIPIWLGAYQPRMLGLVGRLADGWLPSMGYLPSTDALTEGNDRIDEAATSAGREPMAIRRLLNLRAEDLEADRLAELALEFGISVFIAPGDNATDIERFGAETMPAVLEIVENERGRADAPSPVAMASAAVSVLAQPTQVPDALGVRPTPDNGDRLLASTPWQESDRPYPPVPDDVVYSDLGRAVAGHLIDVHDHLRNELGQVRDVIRQVRAGLMDAGTARSAINAMTMRQNEWTVGAYCASYCRLVTAHHSLEDQGIFIHLRRSDATLVPTVDRLQAEHVVIHEVLEDVDAALVAFIRNAAGHQGLQHAVDALTDTLLSHLSYEERALVEPLARYGMMPGQV